jgi:hypothetical protein
MTLPGWIIWSSWLVYTLLLVWGVQNRRMLWSSTSLHPDARALAGKLMRLRRRQPVSWIRAVIGNPESITIRRIQLECETLIGLANSYEQSDSVLAQYVSRLLVGISGLMLRRSIGEISNPIDPRVADSLNIYYRGLAFHIFRNQPARIHDSAARLILQCALRDFAPVTTGKPLYRHFLGLARPSLAEWKAERTRLFETRTHFVTEARDFISDSLRDYSPTAVTTFINKWYGEAVTRRDPHLLAFLALLDANHRQLAILSRRQTTAIARSARLIMEAWAAAILTQDLETQMAMAVKLTALFARLHNRRRSVADVHG